MNLNFKLTCSFGGGNDRDDLIIQDGIVAGNLTLYTYSGHDYLNISEVSEINSGLKVFHWARQRYAAFNGAND